MVMVSDADLANALFVSTTARCDRHCWGTVTAANQDGTLEVELGGPVPATCAALCDAQPGERVFVCITGRSAVVLGKGR